MSDELPGPAEDELLLGRQDGRVEVEPGGQGVGAGELGPVYTPGAPVTIGSGPLAATSSGPV